ncbi:hypothetical protein S7335_3999 [Synechococcus sp. PCC 7335]|nr:hypothetical protein S7335_3999 [Synechococcus sp. PCC 7335]
MTLFNHGYEAYSHRRMIFLLGTLMIAAAGVKNCYLAPMPGAYSRQLL